MDVSRLITHPTTQDSVSQPTDHIHQYPTRRSMSATESNVRGSITPTTNSYFPPDSAAASPYNPQLPSLAPKNVAFELQLDSSSNYRARLPMRVQIFPHDTTESIVTTVKNFYGLYEGATKGVSFEDDAGNTMIARYENFQNNMTVYVRVIQDYSKQVDPHTQYSVALPQDSLRLGDIPQFLPPQPAQILHYGQPPSRPTSRASRKQSTSPKLGKAPSKHRSRPGVKGVGTSFQRQLDELNSDTINGSDSDGGAGSVTSSRKARSEQLATAEISVDNILAGNRRKRAKFESSELPLFVPPQVPAPNSISSVSPQRRSNGLDNPSPFAKPTPRPSGYNPPMQSPQTYGNMDAALGSNTQPNSPFAVPSVNRQGRSLRDRSSNSYFPQRLSSGSGARPGGSGIMPTPDPTIASCISDEDVAMQLMRLGDISNISYGRTSASTLDDAFSGRADAASSATSDSEGESDSTEQTSLPKHSMQATSNTGLGVSINPLKRQRQHLDDNLQSYDSIEAPSGDEGDYDYDDKRDGVLESDPVDPASTAKPKPKAPRPKSVKPAAPKPARPGIMKPLKSKPAQLQAKRAKTSHPPLSIATQYPMNTHPLSPLSHAASRKTSSASTMNFGAHSLPLSGGGGAGEEDDLSSKPRCQRCRKSKKGCDRQRPCQRCRDAGIGIEGCVSEEEGNGRRGRYGRLMGVKVNGGVGRGGSVAASEGGSVNGGNGNVHAGHAAGFGGVGTGMIAGGVQGPKVKRKKTA